MTHPQTRSSPAKPQAAPQKRERVTAPKKHRITAPIAHPIHMEAA